MNAPINISNCPVCNHFPTQFVATDDAKSPTRYRAERNLSDERCSDFYEILHALNQAGANIEVIDLNTLALCDSENLCTTFCFDGSGKLVRVFSHPRVGA